MLFRSYFFTAGRYEYRNKGVDMFIESLARLNHRMKDAGSDMTVVAFIIMPAQTTSLAVEALKGQAVVKSRAAEYSETETCNPSQGGRRIVEAVTARARGVKVDKEAREACSGCLSRGG